MYGGFATQDVPATIVTPEVRAADAASSEDRAAFNASTEKSSLDPSTAAVLALSEEGLVTLGVLLEVACVALQGRYDDALERGVIVPAELLPAATSLADEVGRGISLLERA